MTRNMQRAQELAEMAVQCAELIHDTSLVAAGGDDGSVDDSRARIMLLAVEAYTKAAQCFAALGEGLDGKRHRFVRGVFDDWSANARATFTLRPFLVAWEVNGDAKQMTIDAADESEARRKAADYCRRTYDVEPEGLGVKALTAADFERQRQAMRDLKDCACEA